MAHLLHRRSGHTVPFPATRFVVEAHADTRRLFRLGDTLLLILRTATLCLIVLAFMQPVWRTPAAPTTTPAAPAAITPPLAFGERPRHVAFIIDRTASMQRTHRGHSRFDHARQRALEMLEQLRPPADRASVIFLDRQYAPVLPEPTADIALLTDRLAAAHATYEHGHVPDALQRARELHQRLPDPAARSLHIELFTDAQRTQWSDEPLALNLDLARGLDLPPGPPATLRIHRLGEGDADDVANDALHAPSVHPAQPIVDQPASASVRAIRYAADAAQRTIELRIADQRKTRRVTLEPFTEHTFDFTVTFPEPGPATVRWRFLDGDDALAADDAVGRVVHVRPHRRVHLFTSADADDPDQSAFFMQRALAPAAERGGARAGARARAGVSLEVRPTEALTGPTGEQRDDAPEVIVLVEAGGLSADQLEALHAHLQAAGGVIWSIDSPEAAAALMRFNEKVGEAVIEPRGNDAPEAWAGDGARALSVGRFENPILAAFEGPARAALLRERFNATLRASPGPGAETLLEFDDGDPMLALQWFDAGGLAVFAGDLGPASTDFAKGPMFVPLVHQLLRHLAPGEPAPPNPHPGDRLDPARFHHRADTLTAPDGERTAFARPIRLRQPGLYTLHDRSEQWSDGVWVELDPRQSDLRRLDDLPQRLTIGEGDDPHAPDGPGADDRELRKERDDVTDAPAQEIPLWPWAMLLAAAALVMEPMVLMVLRQRGV